MPAYFRDCARDRTLMRTLGTVYARMGAGAFTFAAAGIERPWKTKFNRRSPRYTTKWEELARVGTV